MTDATDLGRLRVFGGLRIAFAFIWLSNLALLAGRIWQFGSVPEGVWHPQSVALLFGEMPARSYVGLLWWLAAGSTLMVGLGLFTRPASAVCLVASTFLASTLFSVGKLIHSSQVLVLFVAIMAFSDWGNAVSLDAWRARRQGRPLPLSRATHPGWPMRVSIFMLGLLYLASGFIKVVRGNFLERGNLAAFIQLRAEERVARGGDASPVVDAIVDWLVAHPDATQLLAWGALALEFGFLAALLSPRIRLAALAAAISFHGAIGTMTDLTFYPNVYLLYALLAASALLVFRHRMPALARWLPRERPNSTAAPPLLPVMGWMAAAFVALMIAQRTMAGSGDLGSQVAGATLQAILPSIVRPALFPVSLVVGGLAMAAAIAWLARDAWRVVVDRGEPLERTLLYDQDCGFCQQWVRWCERRGGAERVRFSPCQAESDLREQADIGLDDCAHAAYLVERDENGAVVGRHRGAGAVNGVFANIPGWRNAPLRAFGLVYRLNGVRHAEDLVYGWVAANRHRLGSTTCAMPEAPAGDDGAPRP